MCFATVLAIILTITACGDDDDSGAPDAGGAPPDATAIPDATASPYCAGGSAVGSNVLFLEFEGVEITPGPDDATMNTSFIVSSSSMVPPFKADAPDRDGSIAAVTSDVEAVLAPYE